MSAFLNNLVAKGRGTLPRLKPRRPAPYETLPDDPLPDSVDPMPQTSAPMKKPSVPEAAALSSPKVPAAASALPAPNSTTPASNTLSPTPTANTPSTASSAVVPSATPIAAPIVAPIVARRTADAAPSAPSTFAATSLPSTQAQVPRPPAKASPAASRGTERATPVQSHKIGVLPNVETLRPVINAPQIPLVTHAQSQKRSLPTSSKQSESLPLPLLQDEVQIPRPVAPAPAQTPDDAVPTTETPVIEVLIGTIEVVAAQPQLPIAPQRVAVQPGGISLDEFLDGTSRR